MLAGWCSLHTAYPAGLASVVSLQVHLARPVSTLDVRYKSSEWRGFCATLAVNPRDGMGLPCYRSGCRHQASMSPSLRIAAGSQPHSNRSRCPEWALAVKLIHIWSLQPAFVRPRCHLETIAHQPRLKLQPVIGLQRPVSLLSTLVPRVCCSFAPPRIASS